MVERKKLTDFGKAVKKKAVENDITLTEVAKKAGLSLQYLNLIIYGRRSGKKYREKIVNILELKQDRRGQYE